MTGMNAIKFNIIANETSVQTKKTHGELMELKEALNEMGKDLRDVNLGGPIAVFTSLKSFHISFNAALISIPSTHHLSLWFERKFHSLLLSILRRQYLSLSAIFLLQLLSRSCHGWQWQ